MKSKNQQFATYLKLNTTIKEVVLLFAAFFLIAPHETQAAIVFDAVTTNASTADRSSASFSHSTSGNNRLLIVWQAVPIRPSTPSAA